MANIYDMNAAIDKPNLLGTALAGLRVGNEQRALREQRADAATLRGLAPAVMAGEAGALEQAAAIDPAQAAKFQAVGDIQAQKFRNWFTYTDNALQAARKTGNLASVNAALQAGGNFISQMTGKPAPTQWTPDMDAGWEQLRAKVAMIEGGQNQADLPAGYRELDMKARAAGLQPGSPEYQQAMKVGLGLQGRAASGGFGFEIVKGADGKERMARTNPRTGAYEIYDEVTGDFSPIGSAGALNGAGPAPTQAAPGVTVAIDGMPPEQAQAFARGVSALQAAGASPEVLAAFEQAALSQPRTVDAPPTNRAALAVGQSPGQRKFEEESAQQAAQLQFLSQRGQLEADAAAQKEAATAAAKAQAERDAQMTTRTVDAAKTLGLLEQARTLIPLSTGSAIGNLADQGAAAFGFSTDGAQAIAALRTIAGQLTSAMPRMQGPQSDKDVEMYRQMAGDLANPNLPPATRMAALQQIERLNQKYTSPQAAPRQDRAPSSDIDDLLNLYRDR